MKFLLILLLSICLISQPAQAVTSTSETVVPKEFTDNLKEIVQDASTEKSTINTENPKSFFGTITQITDNSIIINSDNQNRSLQLNEDIICINSKRQKVKTSEFKEGDTILAMGYLNQDNSLDCRRIVATETESIENKNQIVTGQIVDVPQSQNSIFAFTPFQNKDTQYQITFDSKTKINNTNEKILKSSDVIIKGKKVIIVMHPNDDNNQTFYATKIIHLENSEPIESTPTQTKE